MAKDFDFLPAKKFPRKQAVQPTPVSRPQAKTKSTQRATRKPKAAHRTAQRMHQTRSSLINYHPLKTATPAKPASVVAPSAPPYLPPARKIPATRPKPKRRFNKKTIISALVSFVAVILLTSGLLIPLLENPSVTIILYIVVAIIFRLNSRVSFSIALLLLLAIPILLIIRNSALAGTYAIFCFYFLVVGVISATIELRGSDN